MRRVVVTGLGLITPLGVGVDINWQSLIQGVSGVKKIPTDLFDLSGLTCTIAGMIPTDPSVNGSFQVDDWINPVQARKSDKFIIYALCAADQALADAGWKPETEEDQERTGVVIGSGIGGMNTIYEAAALLATSEPSKGPRRISPFFIPSSIINLASGQVSIKYGLKGPNHAVVTACSTGSHAIGDAGRMIACGDADVMVAGGSESGGIGRLAFAGFCSLRALSTGFNDRPEQASRPWDQNRDGFVMGEGAGIVVLEEYEHAKKRGAPIYAELVGYGMSGDAFHVTAPAENGDGAYRCMKAAMQRAEINPDSINYVNAHGTSTPVGDMIELTALRRAFGDHTHHMKVSSTKSCTGHLLGAAGSVEAIYTILAMRDGIVPPTINLDNPSPGTEGFDLVPHQAKEQKIGYAMSNSFGFGGTNACLVFKRA